MIEHCKNVTKLGVYCETECIAIGRFGPEGGLLRIVGAAAKVRLEIPKGAVSAPDQLIYMYLQRSPQLDQTAPKYRYSPVVECGPDGLQFNVSRIACHIQRITRFHFFDTSVLISLDVCIIFLCFRGRCY